jgi:glycosyltransferase involved in cell wall biosynthesis
MLKVSLVTAVYNGVGTIARTIGSIAAQTHPDIEHVVIDGASLDGTAALVRSIGSRGLKLLSERDAGVYDAFNKGIRLATGDIIGLLNCGDTYFSPDSVSRVVSAFTDPAIRGAYGDVLIVDEADTTLAVRRYNSARFRPEMLAYGIMPAHPTFFVRRSVYEEFGLYDTSYRIAGDFEFVARVFSRAGIQCRYLNEVLVRMPRGGLSTSGPRASWRITREIRRACAANGIPTNYLKLFSRFAMKLPEFLRPGA